MTEAHSDMAADVMVLAAHPDDAEIACGGSILQLVAAGRDVVIVDMTRGEKGTRGTPEIRKAECEAATKLLGVRARLNLGLPDTALRDDDRTLAALVGALRALRPRVLLAPLPKDLHPDHEAAGLAARRAFFHAGLEKVLPELGAPHRPALLVRYPSHDFVEPTFCVDISAVHEAKRRVVQCYASQVGSAKHLARGDPLERMVARDRFFGGRIGCAAAEPFSVDGPLALRSFVSLLDS